MRLREALAVGAGAIFAAAAAAGAIVLVVRASPVHVGLSSEKRALD